jgi:myosin heavy subunit
LNWLQLQELFFSALFTAEQQQYILEGIEWEPIQPAPTVTLPLLEGPQGLLALLDEECQLPKVHSISPFSFFLFQLS